MLTRELVQRAATHARNRHKAHDTDALPPPAGNTTMYLLVAIFPWAWSGVGFGVFGLFYVTAQVTRDATQQRPTAQWYQQQQDIEREHAHCKQTPDDVDPDRSLLPIFEDHYKWQKNPTENTHEIHSL